MIYNRTNSYDLKLPTSAVTEQLNFASTIAVHIVLSNLRRYIFWGFLLPRGAGKKDRHQDILQP
jgi:hypothetical protein